MNSSHSEESFPDMLISFYLELCRRNIGYCFQNTSLFGGANNICSACTQEGTNSDLEIVKEYIKMKFFDSNNNNDCIEDEDGEDDLTRLSLTVSGIIMSCQKQ